MITYDCKSCGGTLEFQPGDTVGVCDHCGKRVALPKTDDDRISRMYVRADRLRRECEFEKATGILEQIVSEDGADSEAYWSLVLCRYGVVYVEDPRTHKRIPTISRSHMTSVFDDENYLAALQYADPIQREIYEEDAAAVETVRKGYLEVSQQESPFDVFISYKESDGAGNRTVDSQLAYNLYQKLTKEGLKVFFSRVTLEGKMFIRYEPYIFAALNSAPVMIIVGTSKENIESPWVKNEWSRYVGLINNGAAKSLCVAIKGFPPEHLDPVLNVHQVQDLNRLGADDDIVRHIADMFHREKAVTPAPVTVVSGNSNTAPLLERAFLFLEDGDWASADEYCEKVLDQDPKNAQAYLGKLMAALQVRKRERLRDVKDPFDGNSSYQKIQRFGDPALIASLNEDLDFIRERNRVARLEAAYAGAVNAMNGEKTEAASKKIAGQFEALNDYKDSAALREECLNLAEIARKDAIYQKGLQYKENCTVISSLQQAIDVFQSISDWKDSAEQITRCRELIQGIEDQAARRKEEEARKAAEDKALAERRRQEAEAREIAQRKAKKRATLFKVIGGIVAVVALAALIWFGIHFFTEILPKQIEARAQEKYNEAIALRDSGKYQEAYDAFTALNDYKDSASQAQSLIPELQLQKLPADPAVGSTINLGTWPEGSSQAVTWVVLAKEGSRILVCSTHLIDAQPYNAGDTPGAVPWADCSLRAWLNGEFLNKAFSPSVQGIIPEVTVPVGDVGKYGDPTDTQPTADRVFILAQHEYSTYDVYQKIYRDLGIGFYCGTPYAESLYGSEYLDNSWTRGNPYSNSTEAGIYSAYGVGSVDTNKIYGVRPVMWIDLSLLGLNGETVGE